jgi:RimJ/RimL family protein N-acetyltransferase
MIMALELRPLGPAAVTHAAFLDAARESADALARWSPWYHAGYVLADVERWFEQAERLWRERAAFPMAILEAGSGGFLGGVDLHDVQRFGKCEAECGGWVRRTACGRGVGATAIRAMAAFGVNELELARVTLRLRFDNRPARRAAERAGARFEGVLRHGLLIGEARMDAALYSLLPADLARSWTA